MFTKIISFEAKTWLYPGKAGWSFVTVPPTISKEIRSEFKELHRGWGSLPVTATVGQTSWKTSIFYDHKTSSYLLPLKTSIRKLENITTDQVIKAKLLITP